MADYDSSLPVRTEADGSDERLHAKIVDGINPSVNQATVDSDLNLKVEANGDNPAGTDITLRLSELGAPNSDGDYDVTNNTKPAHAGVIVHDRVTTPADANQNFRVTGIQSTDDDTIHAMDVSMMDSNGDPITPTNPLDITIDGDYDVTTNPDPASIGLIAHDRNTTPGEPQQNVRITGVQGTADDTIHALDIALHDEAGDAYTESNPLPVTLSLTGGGDGIQDFKQATDVAKDAVDNHDYSVTGGKTLTVSKIQGSGSGKMKMELYLGSLASGTLALVMFNSTANPNCEYEFAEKLEETTAVRIKMTNLDNQPQDLYSLIEGQEDS